MSLVGVAVVSGIGLAAYGASQGGGGEAASIAPRDIGAETAATLKARLDYAPQLRDMNKADTLANSEVNLGALFQTLYGRAATPGGKEMKTLYRQVEDPGSADSWQRTGGGAPSAGQLSEVRRLQAEGRNGNTYWANNANIEQYLGLKRVGAEPTNHWESYQAEVDTPGTAAHRGVLDLYENDLLPFANRTQAASKRAQLQSDEALLREFGPSYRDALRKLNPDQTGIRDRLYADYADWSKDPSALPPGVLRDIQEKNRWSQELAYSPEAAVQERMRTGYAGEARLNQWRQQGQNLIGLDQSLYGSDQITGRASASGNVASNFIGQGNETANIARAPAFDPMNGYASDLYNTNFNAQYEDLFSQRAADSAQSSALIGLGGSILGSATKLYTAKKYGV